MVLMMLMLLIVVIIITFSFILVEWMAAFKVHCPGIQAVSICSCTPGTFLILYECSGEYQIS